jgi:hypothetical protein
VSEDLNQYLPRWDQASSSAVGQKVKTVWGVGFVLEETYEVYGVAFKDGEGRIVREINKRELEEANSDRDIFSARLFFRDHFDLAKQMQARYPKKTLHEREQENERDERWKEPWIKTKYSG